MARRRASRPGSSFPDKRSSSAFERPMIFESRAVPPWLGIQPIRASGNERIAVSSAIRMSQASASSAPAPRATPVTAATVGFVRCSKAQKASCPRVTCSCASFGASFAHSSMSTPEENTSPPEPATTRARIPSSFSISGTRAARSEIIERRRAFRGGLSIHRTAVAPFFSIRRRGPDGIGPRGERGRIIVADFVHTLFLAGRRYRRDAGGGHRREAVVRAMACRCAPLPGLSGHRGPGVATSHRTRTRGPARPHVLREDADLSGPRCRRRSFRSGSPNDRREGGGPSLPPPPEHPAFRRRVLRGPARGRHRRADEPDPHAPRARGPVERRRRRDGRRARPVLAQRDKDQTSHGNQTSRRLRCCGIPEDAAVLQYTGGTTGTPKGAMLTHRNLVANAMQTAAWFATKSQGSERVLGAIPLFHVYGLTAVMLLSIAKASEVILYPNPREIDAILKLIDKTRPSLFPGVPTMYIAILRNPDLAKYDLRSVRACISGAAPLPNEVRRQFEAATGGRLVEGYGLTEASPVTHCNPINGVVKECIGIPFPDTDAKLVDPEDPSRDMPPKEAGELAVRGPQVMKGYWNHPAETAAVLRDGWLLTGDIAKMDEDGYFSIVDRKKDLILCSGYNVYPREVEEVLFMHPAVAEAAVIGIPDSYRGESVKGFIVLKAGATGMPITAA